MRPLKIVSYGDLVMDILLPIPALPLCARQIQLAHQMYMEPGGAGNFLIMANRLGLKSTALGCAGNDPYGSLLIEKLTQEGIDIQGIQILAGQTTTLVMVLIDDAGEHSFLGVIGTARVNRIPDIFREKIMQADAFFTNGYAFVESSPSQLVLDLMALARQQGQAVFFDPGPQIRDLSPELLRAALGHCDDLLLTSEEASVVFGTLPAEDLARQLLALGPRRVILKQGAQGCLIVDSQTCLHSPACDVTVRDTTGAGDAFDAAFVYGVLQGMPLTETARLANTVAGCAAARIGAGTRLPSRMEIEACLCS